MLDEIAYKMRLSHSFLLLTLFPFCSARDTVPTFLVDYDQVMDHLFIEQNPFAVTSVSKFADIIEDAVTQSSVIIIFVEERLSTEDITTKGADGTPFENLREQLLSYKVKYMPNVLNPVKTLTRLFEPTEFNVVVLQPGQKYEPTEIKRFFYVFFKDGKNESRSGVLRRHDKVMQDVYETTRRIANGAVVAFYTGKFNPVILSKYRYGPWDVFVGEGNDITMASHGALIRFKGLTVDEGARRRKGRYMEDTPVILRDEKSGNTSTSSVVVGNFYMEFLFTFAEENWILDTIKLYKDNEVKGQIKNMDISVPYGRSYYCDEPLMFHIEEDSSSIVIPEYQIQPFRQVEVPAEAIATKATVTTVEAEATNATESAESIEPGEANETPKTEFPIPRPGDPEDFRPITEEERRRRRGLIWGRSGNTTNATTEGSANVTDGNANEVVDDVVDDVEDNGTIDVKLLEFGDSIKCTNYFNIDVLTGLSVFALFLTVVMIGVFSLIHIETNDRFEDPHGKPFYTSTIE